MALAKKCRSDNSGETACSAADCNGQSCSCVVKITQIVDLLCVFREPVIMSLLPYNKQPYKMQNSLSIRMGRLKFLASSVRYVREHACV